MNVSKLGYFNERCEKYIGLTQWLRYHLTAVQLCWLMKQSRHLFHLALVQSRHVLKFQVEMGKVFFKLHSFCLKLILIMIESQ